ENEDRSQSPTGRGESCAAHPLRLCRATNEGGSEGKFADFQMDTRKGIRDDDWPRKRMACGRLDPLRPLRRRNRRAVLDRTAAMDAVRGRIAGLVAPKPEAPHGADERRRPSASNCLVLNLGAATDPRVIPGFRPVYVQRHIGAALRAATERPSANHART